MSARPLLAVLSLTVFFSSCGLTGQPMKIGFSACLSGLGSELGINGMYGAALKIDEINADGGIKGQMLELVSRDDQADPDQAVLMDAELEAEGTVAVIGHMEGDTVEKSVKWAAQRKRLYISPTIGSEAYTGLDDWMFRVVTSNSRQPAVLADMMQEAGIRQVAVLWDNSSKEYSDALKNDFFKQASNNRMEIIHDVSFNLADNPNYMDFLDEVRLSGAEALLLVASSTETAALLEKISLKDIGVPCYMTGWSISGELLDQAGDNMEGAILVSSTNLLSDDPRYLDFIKRFTEKFGFEPSEGAMLSYDAMGVLAEVLHMASDTKPDTLKETLLKIRTFKGLQSDIEFDDYGDVHRPVYKYTVADGKYVLLP